MKSQPQDSVPYAELDFKKAGKLQDELNSILTTLFHSYSPTNETLAIEEATQKLNSLFEQSTLDMLLRIMKPAQLMAPKKDTDFKDLAEVYEKAVMKEIADLTE